MLTLTTSNPLVSVTIPTRSWHRNMFSRAIDCYKNQTYVNLELIVVEDGPSSNIDLIKHSMNRVKFFHAPFANLAMKRNFATSVAAGEYICHFDDDDWSGPNRIKDQLGYFLQTGVSLVGYGKTKWYNSVKKEAYLFKGAAWGASIMYRRDYAIRNPFPNIMLAEDAPFIAGCQSKLVVDGNDNFVATQHNDNTPRDYSDINAWDKISRLNLPWNFYSAVDKPREKLL